MHPFPRFAFVLAAICNLALRGPAFVEERLKSNPAISRSRFVCRSPVQSLLPAGLRHPMPLLEGSFEPSIPHMQLAIDARRMRVLEGGLSVNERQAVQARMLGADVLDVERFPFISFHSIEIERPDGARWLVRGELGLHGHVRAAAVSVIPGHNRYTGLRLFGRATTVLLPAPSRAAWSR